MGEILKFGSLKIINDQDTTITDYGIAVAREPIEPTELLS